MISVVIPYYENRPEKRGMLERAVRSFTGQDEIIVIWNEGKGFAPSVNLGCKLSKGDYIIVASDDCFVTEGSLSDLAIPGTVTSPMVNGVNQAYSGVMWCVPRDIYEMYGMLDEEYAKGIFYEDEDYWLMLKSNNIPHRCVESVKVSHPEGGATLKRADSFNERVQINRDYFDKKWGIK